MGKVINRRKIPRWKTLQGFFLGGKKRGGALSTGVPDGRVTLPQVQDFDREKERRDQVTTGDKGAINDACQEHVGDQWQGGCVASNIGRVPHGG